MDRCRCQLAVFHLFGCFRKITEPDISEQLHTGDRAKGASSYSWKPTTILPKIAGVYHKNVTQPEPTFL